MDMKRRSHKHVVHHRKSPRAAKVSEGYLVLVRSWVLVVMFAIMLGVGAIAGSFLNSQVLQTTPQVAGATTSQ